MPDGRPDSSSSPTAAAALLAALRPLLAELVAEELERRDAVGARISSLEAREPVLAVGGVQSRAQAAQSRAGAECGAELDPSLRRDARFCSTTCRSRARRARQ